ncbi:HalOD1 output domain-containing protein [Natrialbaceae archaeon GCM10025810]|uniref:HalOD1 output domain-containing protein n=1 Tax=Halovalidus salilacus TaxID=3075124 RepID=UPI00361B1B70
MTYDSVTEITSVRVVEALAAALETSPFDMEPPLYDAIDPEALDLLFRDGTDGEVRFAYEGHAVTVRSDGTVIVDETTYVPR